MKIVPIVEGHGEVVAVPVLVRRIAEAVAPDVWPEVLPPLRVRRQRLLKPGELEKAVAFAGSKAAPDGGILVLLDADTDCPSQLAPELLRRAADARRDRRLRVVVAKVEYETWFLAAAESLAGKRGLTAPLTPPADPESVANPKRWLRDHMEGSRTYSETLDQPALTALMDLTAARRAPSFDKMWRDVTALLAHEDG